MRQMMKKFLFPVLLAALFIAACGKKETPPGYYTLTGMTVDGEELSRRDVRELEGYIVVEEGGTGWVVFGRDVSDIEWDETTMTTLNDNETLDFTLAEGVLTIGDPDDMQMVFTRSEDTPPEKPAPRPDISDKTGTYVLIEADGEIAEEGAGNIIIFEDYTATLNVADLMEVPEIDIDRRTIIFYDVDGADLEGSIRNEVIELEIDSTEYVFALEGSDRHAEWQEALTAVPDGAGYYKIVEMRQEDTVLTADDLATVGLEVYVVMEEDGTGYFVMAAGDETEVQGFTWNEGYITFDDGYFPQPYTIENGILTMTEDNATLVFERSTDPVPARPASTGGGATGGGTTAGPGEPGAPSGVAATSIEFLNTSNDELVNVWISPAANENWGEATNGTVASGNGTFTVGIDAVGGAGSYDIRITDTDEWVYEIYGVELTGGMRLTYSTDYSQSVIVTTDAEGNTYTYTGSAEP